MAGIYIHVPFCASRCIYCDFYTTINLENQNRLVRALCSELDMRRNYLQDNTPPNAPIVIDTIYLGGGTPSQLSEENLHRLFSAIYNKVENDVSFKFRPMLRLQWSVIQTTSPHNLLKQSLSYP